MKYELCEILLNKEKPEDPGSEWVIREKRWGGRIITRLGPDHDPEQARNIVERLNA